MRGAGAVSIPELLERRARDMPGRTAFVYDGQAWSFGRLRAEAERFAGFLLRKGLAREEPIVIALPNGPDFLRAFHGAQRAGGVPVPLADVSEPARFADIARQAGARGLIVSPGIAREMRRLVSAGSGGKEGFVVDVTEAPGESSRAAPLPAAGPEDLCFLQYTSGSTGNPKGVQLSHGNVLANLQSLVDGMEITENDVFVSWLPLYHDMGLVLMAMAPLFVGAPLVLLPARLTRGNAWLRAIERYRGTFTAAPDFAYRFCCRYMRNPGRLDLSGLRVALDAAEPVRAGTIVEFEERYGLRNVVMPGYGLAEATVGVSMWPPGRPIRTDPDGRVSVGPPFPGVEVRIADGNDAVETGAVGEILVRSASTTRGYWKNPGETARIVAADGFIRTGDLGRLDREGNLYVVGRSKEIIIQGGRNISPPEVEETVDPLPGVRFSAAVGLDRGRGDGEQLYLFAEVRDGRTAEADRPGMATEIVRRIHRRFGFRPARVYLLGKHGIPRTPNGKIRHSVLRSRFLDGSLRRGGHIIYPDF